MFDVNHDGKIYWTEFEKGIEQCTVKNDAEFDAFIFHFCSLLVSPVPSLYSLASTTSQK